MGDNKGARLTKLSKGDKVLNNAKTMDYLMFNNDLNNILTGNNISSPKVELNAPSVDLTPVVNAINNKPVFGQRITNGELKDYLSNGSEEIERTNKRRGFQGSNV